MSGSVASLSPEDREAIRRMTEQEWTSAALARDWDRALALCSPDVVYMPADQPILRGHAELRNWFDQFPRILKFTQPLEDVEQEGNLAIARATFSATVEVSGQRAESTGKALCWLQRDSAGRWLIKAVCWNWDRPLAPTT
jgi:ketosteroid isomerase-like protein